MTEPRDDLEAVCERALRDSSTKGEQKYSVRARRLADVLRAAYPQLAATSGSVERQETYFNGTRTSIRRTVYATPWEDAP